MKKRITARSVLAIALLYCTAAGCIDPIPADEDSRTEDQAEYGPTLAEIAGLLAELPLEQEHIKEIHDAVSASSANGYDEEYTMSNLFANPGAGVGDEHLQLKSEAEYDKPLSSLIREHLVSRIGTKAAGPSGITVGSEEDVERYIGLLASSDIQVYWPFSENWSGGDKIPIITYDPEDESSTNIGYRLRRDMTGATEIETVVVDEQMAEKYPVWVVNRNSDEGHLSLDMIRKLYPGWTLEGGEIVINPSKASGTKTGTSGEISGKSLTLQDFTMYRNYDTWFAGASEFFIKCGAVENFTASTEAELQLYSPSITDFMIVVKRSQVGETLPFKVVLFSDWTGQVENCAFMIIEDDGGKQTSWKCTAVVKIASKSYGFEVDLPFRTRDDIVWRGSLSRRYLEAHNGVRENFGDVAVTFAIEEY